MPLAIKYLLTGNATIKAAMSESSILLQNSDVFKPALIAFGTSMTNPLSTISMTAIERVSAIRTSVNAFLMDKLARSNGTELNEYPNKNARPIDNIMLGTVVQFNADDITIPKTSPMAHPVRQ